MARKRLADGRSRWKKTHSAAVHSKATQNTALRNRIAQIPRMPLRQLPSVIEEARQPQNIELQEDVVRAALQRILSVDQLEVRHPKDDQVRALRQLIFIKSDVLLIAQTGFGKSIIFHAFSILTGQITIQLIPLTKLGDEQLEEIRRFDGARPCLVNAQTRRSAKKLMTEIKNGQYTHILLGPEQASSKAFREVIKSEKFQPRIGLVAIDECHLITQWEDFRAAYTMIGELRHILRPHVVWFGCSATLDEASEQCVLRKGGFRCVGAGIFKTQIIRTTIDRPDIRLAVLSLPRGKLLSWDALYFLLAQAVHNKQATPEKIPKTIVYIDGRLAIQEASVWAMNMLLRMSDQYSVNPSAGKYCVSNIIRIYTANVAQYDRDCTYTDFKRSPSLIRLVFATTSLGMGVNIPDIARVVTWKIPITKSLGDLWQRVGRGGRGPGCTSTAYILLPYWLFDNQGRSKPATDESVIGEKKRRKRMPVQITRPSRLRDWIPKQSQLSQSVTPGDIVDTPDDLEEPVASQIEVEAAPDGSQNPTASQTEIVPNESQNTATSQVEIVSGPTVVSEQPLNWTKTEETYRTEVRQPWLRLANHECHRKVFLEDLGEFKLEQSQRQDVDATVCCSACNPSLLPDLQFLPDPPKPLRPRAGTFTFFMCQAVDAFAVRRATALFSTDDSRFPFPAGMFMESNCRLELGYACAQMWTNRAQAQSVINEEGSLNVLFGDRVPSLSTWELLSSESDILVWALPDIVCDAEDRQLQYRTERNERQQRRNREQDQLVLTAELATSKRGAYSGAGLNTVSRQYDNNEAAYTAIRERDRRVAEKARTSGPVLAISTTSPRMQPTTPVLQQSPQTREMIERTIRSTDSDFKIPPDIDPILEAGLEQIRRIRMRYGYSPSATPTPSTPLLLDENDITPTPVTPPILDENDIHQIPRKRAPLREQRPTEMNKRRKLVQKETSTSKPILSFTRVTRSGRERTKPPDKYKDLFR